MSRTPERVRFPTHEGHELVGRLHRPVGESRGTALFAHCFTCSKDLRAARRITEALTDKGFTTLRFDFTGLGESEGDFADSTFSSNVQDLVAAARWLAPREGPVDLLVGHSLGGAAVLVAGCELDEVRAVATIAAPSDPAHVEHLFDGEVIRERGEAIVTLAGRPFRVRREFLEDLSIHGLDDKLKRLRKPLLVLHAPQDTTVGVEHARHIFEQAHHPKSFVSLDGADHLLTDPDDAAYVGDVIASWAARYASAPVEIRRARHHDDVEVFTGATGFATEGVARRIHRFRADEPLELGGTDTGMTPYEYVSAGLAACTSMTLRMYADRKGLALEGVEVHVRHGKVHARDCASCETGSGRIDRFEREIRLFGELTPAERTRLLEIADRCPVHRTLHGEAEVLTRAVDGS